MNETILRREKADDNVKLTVGFFAASGSKN